MLVGFIDLSARQVIDKERADIGVMGELIEIVGDARLAEQAQDLRQGLFVGRRMIGVERRPAGRLAQSLGADEGAQRHAVCEFLQPRVIIF